MSTAPAAAATTATNETEKKSAPRRRSAGSRRPRQRKPSGEPKAEGAADGADEAESKRIERVPPVPVPEDMFGKPIEGTVTVTVRKGRVRYGFIHLGDTTAKSLDELPRVYFSFDQLVDSSLTLRKGYPVSLVIQKDEKGRSFATNIELTAAGEKIKVDREAEIAQKREERAAAEATEKAAAPKQKAAPKARKQQEPRLVSLLVSVEGSTEPKVVELDLNSSIPRLKTVAALAHGAPLEYVIYHLPEGQTETVFLTKAVLNKLTENDKLHLAPRKEVPAEEAAEGEKAAEEPAAAESS